MEKTDGRNGISIPKVLYNCYIDGDREGEAFVSDHVFSYILSGTQQVWTGNQVLSFQPGDYRFFRRNQLTKYIKRSGGEGFRSVSIHIDQETLLNISREYNLKAEGPIIGNAVQMLRPNKYFKAFIDSLLPYFNGSGETDEMIVRLKTKELVLILLETNPALKNVLFDFSKPGKIDLEGFMNAHYRYNVGIDRFAFLTGRSLAAFKRDFAKQFDNSPNRWLVQKRLEEARYLIEEQQKRPSDIYLDLGFMDLSHFSFAYRKAFGKTPTGR